MRWVTFCLLSALVATCGQTGPLRLPEEPQATLPVPADNRW